MPTWIQKWVRPRDLTLQQKQALTTQQMQSMITDLFQEMLKVYTDGVKLVQNNPYGLTQDQVEAGFGDSAAELTRLAMLLKDCINIAAPGTIDDPNDPYGSIIVSAKKRVKFR